MKNLKNYFSGFFFLLIVFFIPINQIYALVSKGNDVNSHASCQSKNNFELSPYTGYTREHWLEITEKIIAGALPYLDKETGMPDMSKSIEDSAFSKIRIKNPDEENKRVLERIMMAVIFYNKATGHDHVPGFQYSIITPFLKAITKGTDPNDPNYWGDPKPNDQVGSSFALGIYLCPNIFWEPLSKEQKQNILRYFQKQVFNQTYDNNHYLFHMIPVALLDKYGYDSNREHLTEMFKRLLGWYRGDGWFIDGNNGGLDNYNLWGFQLFYQILDQFDEKWKNQFDDQIKQVTTRFLEPFPYFFGRDGGPIPWGRSLTYRFANISFIGWSVLNKNCTLPPGQARRIASGTLKYFWEHGCLGSNNLLNIGYWGQNESIAESYITPGDPYWATQGLSCLLIPENDPFWNAIEEPIPADGAGGKIAIPGAQMTIRVSPIDGEARLFPVGQPYKHERQMWQGGTKYDQYSYSSYLGFCVTGEGDSEIGAGRSGYSIDGLNWHYRERARPIVIENDYIVDQFQLQTDEEYKITTHTIIGNEGEIHIFWHDYPEPIFLYLGGYAIRLNQDELINSVINENEITINSEEYYSVLKSLKTYNGDFKSEIINPRAGWDNTHLFGGKGAFTSWKSKTPIPPLTPIIIYTNGTRGRKPLYSSMKIVENQGEIKIFFEGKWVEIKIPY